jgi:hypothetical protein
MEKYHDSFIGTNKYLTTNCFTRIDRLYHPSDMFVAGSQRTLSKLFGAAHSQHTQLDAEILVRRLVDRGEDPNSAYLWPESYLFTQFLNASGWNIQNSYEDSQAALEKHVVVVNSYTVRLKWEKKIFKYVFPFTAKKYPPFFGGPLEDSVCANATLGTNHLGEFVFWQAARIDTFLWVRSSPTKMTREFLIKQRMRIVRFIVAWTPPIILRAFFSSFLYRIFKAFESRIAKKF